MQRGLWARDKFVDKIFCCQYYTIVANAGGRYKWGKGQRFVEVGEGAPDEEGV
jgi:hypothetical protein